MTTTYTRIDIHRGERSTSCFPFLISLAGRCAPPSTTQHGKFLAFGPIHTICFLRGHATGQVPGATHTNECCFVIPDQTVALIAAWFCLWYAYGRTYDSSVYLLRRLRMVLPYISAYCRIRGLGSCFLPYSVRLNSPSISTPCNTYDVFMKQP